MLIVESPAPQDTAPQQPARVRVLVVDDEPALTDLLSMALRYEGWDVYTAGTGPRGLELAQAIQPDLVVLDVMLPGMDGLEVLRRLRLEAPSVPVLFLTARDEAEDRARCLAAGGNDYLPKPFSLTELVARLTRLLHVGTAPAPGALTVGDLTLDEQTHLVRRGGEALRLNATEFDLLRLLMRNAGQILSRAQIIDAIWQHDFGGHTDIVEIYLAYLRRKIDHGRPPMIHTVPGVGYLLRAAG